MKLQQNDKKMNKDLKKLITTKQPSVNLFLIQSNKKMLAQNILKNQKYINKYKNLDAQLQSTSFQ